MLLLNVIGFAALILLPPTVSRVVLRRPFTPREWSGYAGWVITLAVAIGIGYWMKLGSW